MNGRFKHIDALTIALRLGREGYEARTCFYPKRVLMRSFSSHSDHTPYAEVDIYVRDTDIGLEELLRMQRKLEGLGYQVQFDGNAYFNVLSSTHIREESHAA